MSSIYKRGKVWQIKFMFDRKPHQYSLKTKNKTRAQYLQRIISDLLDVGIFPDLNEIMMESPTGHDLFNYLKMIQNETDNNTSLATSYRKRLRIFLNHFREFLRNENIRFFPQVKISTAAKYRNWRLSKPSEKTKGTIAPKTVKEELMFLKNKVFERAVDEKIIAENPFRRAVRELKVYKREILPFTEEEVQKLISNASNQLHKDFYTVLYYTGSRFGEVANLEWSDIDFDKNLCYIRNKLDLKTKTRKSRVIPLHQDLTEVFKDRHHHSNSRYIFPSPNTNDKPVKILLRKFTETRNKLGIDPHKTLHSFRHAFASHLQKRGVPIEIIQELLGHADIRMTRHYQKIDLSVLQNAISKLQINI
jgi:integrase